ncbi:MAG TPA: PaaI family thioesterase [Burkholderiaceae bacterium]
MSSAVDELRSVLDGQPKPDCAALTPFSVEEADFDLGRVVLLFAPQPAFKNHFGNVQGGFAVAMVDVLASVAAYAKTKQWLPTIEIKSSFVAPMKLGECRGEGVVVKAGRQVVFLEAKLWGADGRLAVHATATAAVPAPA